MAKLTNPPTPESDEPSVLPAVQPPALPTVLPTEQLETAPMPVSASAAASGGVTGLSSTTERTTPRENLSIFRRHPLAAGLVAGILAVLVVSSLTAWAVGTAVAAALTSQAAPVTPLSTATPAPGAIGGQGGRLAAGQVAFRATVQNIDDSTWTILTRRGQTVTITVNDSTQFGTKRVPETQDSFAVGDNVIVLATSQNGDAMAVRVVNAADAGAMPTPSPSSSATT